MNYNRRTGLDICFVTEQVADRRNKGWSEEMIRVELLGCMLSDANAVIIPYLESFTLSLHADGETQLLVRLLQFVAALEAIRKVGKPVREIDTLEFARAMDDFLDTKLAAFNLFRSQKSETATTN